MAQVLKASLLALLLLGGSASAIVVGPARGKPVPGRPLEVNIPFAVDQPADRACASANVRYGKEPVPRMTLHVQGHGLKRNLLVTSRTSVNEQPVTVNVRVGCGAKAVTRSFTLPAATLAAKPVQKPVSFTPAAEPLFPPPAVAEAAPPEPKADAAMAEELRQAKTTMATTLAQLAATRKELAAVLDVVRRMSQTLITADHQVREAKSEVAHMRLVLKFIGAGLALVAAGVIWFEFNRVQWRRRRAASEQPPQEPTVLTGMEVAA